MYFFIVPIISRRFFIQEEKMATYLDPDGEATAMNGVLNDMYNALFPTNIPGMTSMAIPGISEPGERGDLPTDVLTRTLIAAITEQGDAGTVPWSNEMDSDFNQIFGGAEISYIDTSVVSTGEQMNDNILEKFYMSQPWNDGSEQKFEQYMPLFNLKPDPQNSTPGFIPQATPVLINQIQAQLLKAERDGRLSVAMGAADAARNRFGALLPLTDPNAKRRRIVGGSTPYDRVRYESTHNGRIEQSPEMEKLATLRWFGALSAEELYAKINYAGPITQIWEGNGPKPRPMYGGAKNSRINHRLISTSWHNRGKIVNIFATDPRPGDNLYFKIAPFSREQLAQLSIEDGTSRNVSGTHSGYGDESLRVTPYISARGDASDAFVQLRGFSSREQRQFMGDTSAVDEMKPHLADRFYVEREHRAAMEWREFIYDPETGDMRERNLLDEEGEQEVRENLPSIVLENYKSLGVIIPVGVIKSKLNRRVSEQAILNAHYDHQAMAAMPHFDIYQNHAT